MSTASFECGCPDCRHDRSCQCPQVDEIEELQKDRLRLNWLIDNAARPPCQNGGDIILLILADDVPKRSQVGPDPESTKWHSAVRASIDKRR